MPTVDQPKIERVLRLMKLLSGPAQLPVEEVARRLGTSPRSVYRYIDTFKEAGFVVYKPAPGVYRLGTDDDKLDGFGRLTHFTEDEANIFDQLLDALDDTNELKKGLRRKLSSVYECTAMAGSTIRSRNAENIQRLRHAMEAKVQVILRGYSSAHSASVSDRRVEAFGFSTNYVQIWCLDTKDLSVKMFKTSRVDSVEVTREPWAHEPLHKVVHEDIFRMTGFEVHPVDLRLGLRARSLLLEEYPQAAAFVERVSEGRWRLATGVCDFAGVGRFVLGLADDIEVLGSDEFLAYLRGCVKRMKF